MTRAFLAMAALLGGCAIGAGTSTVGIWRAQRVVDTEVCVQDHADHCTSTVEVARDVPERSFGGGLFAYFNPGYGYVSGASGDGSHLFQLDSHFEYMRGRGGLGGGLRVGANVGFGSGTMLFTVPVTLVGHWGTERYSLYGGPGYTPYASGKVTIGNTKMTTELHGFNVLVGGRVLLTAERQYRMTASIDVFRQYLDDVVVTSATTGIGLHF